jgi:hypothetical protein
MPQVEELIDVRQVKHAAAGTAPFERNEFMERLIELRAVRQQAFAVLSLVVKLALRYYEAAPRRHRCSRLITQTSTPRSPINRAICASRADSSAVACAANIFANPKARPLI